MRWLRRIISIEAIKEDNRQLSKSIEMKINENMNEFRREVMNQLEENDKNWKQKLAEINDHQKQINQEIDIK